MPAADNTPDKTVIKSLTPAVYDLYAPAVYGKILSIVHKGPIADKILEKVFINMYKGNQPTAYHLQAPLIRLLNHAREDSYKIVKALILFRECCSGSSVHITNKTLPPD